MHRILSLIFILWIPLTIFSQPDPLPLPACATGYNKSINTINGNVGFWNVDVTMRDEVLLDLSFSRWDLNNTNLIYNNGLAVMSPDGQTKFANLLPETIDNHGYLNGYASKKGGIFFLSTANSIPANLPLTMQLSRYNENFDEQWNHLIRLEQNGPFREMAYKLTEDEDGNIYIAFLQQYISNSDARVRILKLTETGNIIWDKAYASRTGTLEDLRMTINKEKLYIAIKTWNPLGTLLVRIHAENGGLDFAKMIGNEGSHPWLAYGGLFNTGEKLIMAGTLIRNSGNLATTVALDFDGNLLGARQIIMPGVVAQADYKKDNLTMLFSTTSGQEYIIQTSDNLDSFRQRPILLARTLHGRSLKLSNDGTSFYIAGLYPDGIFNSNGALLKIPVEGAMGDCIGSEALINTLPQALEIVDWPMSAMQSTSTLIKDQKFNFQPITLRNEADFCFVPQGCDTLLLAGETRVCDTSFTYTYTWQAGSNCNQKPFFYFDPEKMKLVEQTAQQAKFQFLQTGDLLIRATIRDGCNAFSDSLEIQVTHASSTFQPWRDTTLCQGDTLQLEAHPGFDQYTWNDGLTTTKRLIYTPGLYRVEMKSGCGIIYTDSIRITNKIPPALLMARDTTVCKGQATTLQATPGFTHYEWQGPANRKVTGPLLSLDGLEAGVWTINANINGGCIQTDTLLFGIKIPASFSLGNDTSFCRGDTLLLQAPPWLSDPNWQNGSRLQNFNAFATGIYTVSGKDSNGCYIDESIEILAVHDLPDVNLGQSGPRCATNDYKIDAGQHTSYYWQNGSTTRHFPVSDAGIFWVTVQNEFRCSATDSLTISDWRKPPNGFLNDTLSFCRYQTTEITATNAYSTYLWNTGANTRSIDVNQPGVYYLQVTDGFGCQGSDSISVSVRTCLEGVHIPNAFTPNGDGRNDFFNAITNTPFIDFEFIIYSRFGEIIFKTNTPALGWDGKYKGLPMPSAAYVWVCRYQLVNDEPEVQKGTVLLLR